MLSWAKMLEELEERFPMEDFEGTIEAWVNRIRRIEDMQKRIVGHLATPMLVPDLPIKLEPGGTLPTRAHGTDACFDCYVRHPSQTLYTLRPGEASIIPLGFKLAVPTGWKVMIWGRSGLAANKANDGRESIWTHVGTVDSGYRDEVGVILFNHGRCLQNAVHGRRIAQLSLERVHGFEFKLVDQLDTEGDRGGGFGSTGQ